jgi:hypothetical protein
MLFFSDCVNDERRSSWYILYIIVLTFVASAKLLQGYCYFQRLLFHFITKYPQLKKTADAQIDEFIKDQNKRIKKVINSYSPKNSQYINQFVPALGEFLPLLLVSDRTWHDVATAYLKEQLTRNVRWLLVSAPELSRYSPDSEIDATRNELTFQLSSVSMKLLMFHVAFLRIVGRPPNLTLSQLMTDYDKHLGHPSTATKENLFNAVQDIQQVTSWGYYCSHFTF